MKILKKYLDTICITSLTFFPVLLWLALSPPVLKPPYLEVIFKTAGQFVGIIGATLFSLNFVLAARFKIVEDIYRGLNRVYISHHKLGAYSFILMLFHPVLLGFQYLPLSIVLVADFFLPNFTNLPIWLGIIGLITMIVLLFITFFVKLQYQTWKKTHEFLGIGLLFGSIHAFLVPGVLSSNNPLKIYMIGIMIIGILSYLYKTVLGRFLVKKFRFKVNHIDQKGEDIVEIFMDPVADDMYYKPGQFLFFQVSSLGIAKEVHPFSITSSPNKKQLSVAIKSVGDYTETLKLIKISSEVTVEGPYGRFYYDTCGNTKQIWIAGGIGIAPFLSMLRSLPEKHSYSIDFYYVVSKQEEAVYLEELKTLCSKTSGTRIIAIYTKIHGRPSADMILGVTKDMEQRDIFICGPPMMMQSIRSQCVSRGMLDDHIHSEEFSMLI